MKTKQHKIILTQIKRACDAFPENMLAGYIVSLIEGQPNEDFVKAWKKTEVKYKEAFVALAKEKEAGEVDSSPGTTDDAPREGGVCNDANEGVVHEPSDPPRRRRLRHNGNSPRRRTRRAHATKHNSGGQVSPPTEDVTDNE